MTILERILADKRVEIAERKRETPLSALETRADEMPAPPDFVAALRAAPIGLIAEVKRRSPSAGVIRDPFDPAAIARAYADAGAQAVSCLMDEPYFGGGEPDFRSVREAIDLPMLYKEFVVDEWQIAHAATLGASALLLIVAALSDAELARFVAGARTRRMTPLVEVHDREELRRALDAGATCIGINNRDLKTFVTSLDTTFELLSDAPADCTLVSESGIKTAEDVLRLKNAGVHALLVGESLLRRPDLREALRNLTSLVR